MAASHFPALAFIRPRAQDFGLDPVGQDLLGIGGDRLVEIGQGFVPFPGFRLHQAAAPQQHRIAGQRADRLIEIGQSLPGVAPQHGAAEQGLGVQTGVVAGQRDRLVEGLDRFCLVAARQQVQFGDLELGLRLLWAELQAFFQIGQGLAAARFPTIIGRCLVALVALVELGKKRALGVCAQFQNPVGLLGRQAAALHKGRCHQVSGESRVALVEALFQCALTELDHLRQLVRRLGAEFLLGGLVKIGLAFVRRAGRNWKGAHRQCKPSQH